ncbi:hypothetical protein [Pseudomonas sp. Sample_16]|uniref:hypothetical protein n=1 Tax=Pseudomonas sp. Sample_16 TaxID=2448263 RepID=UPI0015B0704B|nr:hypothetical protein [Pseudomonas sp. Sample_16]
MTSSLQEKTEPVGARLAGEDVHENAFAGKPGAYEKHTQRMPVARAIGGNCVLKRRRRE